MVLKKIISFWNKYENLNLKIAFFLIALQVVHLYWLTTDVVLNRIFGESFFILPQEQFSPETFLPFIVIDYLEVPALFAGITYYLFNIYRDRGNRRNNIIFLAMLASQVFHIFWITDEIVYGILFNTTLVAIPPLLAWVAILIDYLELPVIFDLFKRVATGKNGK